ERNNTRVRICKCARVQYTLDDAPLACNGICEVLDIADADEFHSNRLTGEKYIGLGFDFIWHNHIAVGSTNLYLLSGGIAQIVYFQGHMERCDRAEVFLYSIEYPLRRRF